MSTFKKILLGFGILVIIGAIGSAFGGGNNEEAEEAEETVAESVTEEKKEESTEENKEEEKEIEYISVTADELSDMLSDNALKAENNYKDKYLEITGKLGTIDSKGKYIGINSDKDFDLTIIQCYIKSDEQKEIIMEMSRGDSITIKGYCKDIGEVLGYQIDIDEIIK